MLKSPKSSHLAQTIPDGAPLTQGVEYFPELLIFPEGSLYCRLSRFLLEHPFSVKELVEELHWVDDAKILNRWELLEPSPHIPRGLEGLLKAVGVDADNYLELTGQDFVIRHVPVSFDSWLCRVLRFCPECIEFGFHSSFYQHWVINRCPLHGTALLARCPKCLQPIDGMASFVIRDPFACPRCGALLSRDCDGYLSQKRQKEIRLLSIMIHDWKRDVIWSQQAGVYTSRPDGLPRVCPDGLSDVVLAVKAQRHLVWATAPGGRWRSFHDWAEIPITLAPKPFETAIQEIKCAVIFEFQRIGRMIDGFDAEIKELLSRVGRRATGGRLIGYASVVSVAYCKMLYAWGLSEDPRNEDYANLDAMMNRHIRNSMRVFLGWEQVFQLTIATDMEAMLALLLVECARYRYLEDIAWNADPSPSRYRSAWCMNVCGSMGFFRLRPRIRRGLLERLILRYQKQLLVARHGTRLGPVLEPLDNR